jgi:hypothetical protein
MKAIVQDRCGSADVLEFRDIDDPVVAGSRRTARWGRIRRWARRAC